MTSRSVVAAAISFAVAFVGSIRLAQAGKSRADVTAAALRDALVSGDKKAILELACDGVVPDSELFRSAMSHAKGADGRVWLKPMARRGVHRRGKLKWYVIVVNRFDIDISFSLHVGINRRGRIAVLQVGATGML